MAGMAQDPSTAPLITGGQDRQGPATELRGEASAGGMTPNLMPVLKTSWQCWVEVRGHPWVAAMVKWWRPSKKGTCFRKHPAMAAPRPCPAAEVHQTNRWRAPPWHGRPCRPAHGVCVRPGSPRRGRGRRPLRYCHRIVRWVPGHRQQCRWFLCSGTHPRQHRLSFRTPGFLPVDVDLPLFQEGASYQLPDPSRSVRGRAWFSGPLSLRANGNASGLGHR